MGGQFNINSKHLANPARLARAFELGQIGGAEGFEIIGLLEVELKNDSWSQAPGELLALLAAYREALTMGGRQNVYALGEAIGRELRNAHGLLEKIRARVGMETPILFGSSAEISARVTEALRRRQNHHELFDSPAPFSMTASEKRRPQGVPVQRPPAEREIELENISVDIPAVAAVGKEPLQLGQLGEFQLTLAVSQKPGDPTAFIGKVFVNGWNTGIGTIEIGFREDKTVEFRYLENLSDYQSHDHVLLSKEEIVRFLKAWKEAYNQDALKPPRPAPLHSIFSNAEVRLRLEFGGIVFGSEFGENVPSHKRDLFLFEKEGNIEELVQNVLSEDASTSVWLVQIRHNAKIVVVAERAEITAEYKQLLQWFADRSKHTVVLYSRASSHPHEFLTHAPILAGNDRIIVRHVELGRARPLAEKIKPGLPLVIISLPRMGKTTLAESVRDELGEKTTTYRLLIDMRNSKYHPDLNTFLKAEVKRIIYHIQKSRGIESPSTLPDGPSPSPLQLLDEWLRANGLTVSIIFDEAVAESSYKELGSMVQSLKNIYSIVVLHRSPAVLGELGKIFPEGKAIVHHLGFLNREEAGVLIANLAQSNRVEVSPDVADRLYEMSGGHIPTLQDLFSKWRGSSSFDFETGVIVEKLAKELIRPTDFSEEERKLLAEVAGDKRLKKEEVNKEALEALMSIGLVGVNAEGHLQIQGSLIKEAIVKANLIPLAKDYAALLRLGFPDEFNATDELHRLIGERGEPKNEEEFCRLVKDVALKMLEEGDKPDQAYLYEADVKLLLKFIDAHLAERLSSDEELSEIRQRLADFEEERRKPQALGTAAVVAKERARTRKVVVALGLPEDFAQKLLDENITSPKLLETLLIQWPDEDQLSGGKRKPLSNHNLGYLLRDTLGQVLTYAPVTGEEGVAALANLVVIIRKARAAGIEVPIEDRLWQEALQLSGRGQTKIGYPPPPSSSDR